MHLKCNSFNPNHDWVSSEKRYVPPQTMISPPEHHIINNKKLYNRYEKGM